MDTYVRNNRVLFVDDDAAVLSAVTSLLRGEDVEVHVLLESSRIEEVLKRDGPFAAVFTDHRMPGFDGVSVLAAVARIHPTTIRAMVTGCAEQGDLQRAINIGGITSYVQKPWDDQELRRLTMDYIARYNLSLEKAALVEQLTSSYGSLAELAEHANSSEGSQCKEVDEVVGALLRERELMLREIHHRVKNNMQVISSLLGLQSSKIYDKATRKLFDDSIQRIRSMALVHEALYKSEDLGNIKFTEYTRSLVASLAIALKIDRVAWHVEGETALIGIDTAIPLGLIVNELVANAFIHGFPREAEGCIHVRIHREDDNILELRVKDNGRGIPEEVDALHPDSLGLGIVAALVDQLNGTAVVSREHGTEFTIRLTLPPSRDGRYARA